MNRRELMLAGIALALPFPAAAAAATPAEWTPAQFHAARRFVDLPVGRVAYVERGSGPVAIFLHGYPLNGFQWRGPMALLATHRRCVTPDLMGLGYSEIPAGTSLSPIAQSEMIVAFMDRLGIAEADFVANDSATGIAQLIAANAPNRVRSLLLTNGDVDINSPPELLMPFIEQCRNGQADAWFLRHYRDRNWARTGDGLASTFRHPEKALSDENIEVYFGPLVATSERLAQARRYGTDMLPNPLPAIAPKLRTFPRPVRMVWARNLDLFPDDGAVWLDRTFPASRGIRFVDDAKLFFPEERPDLIADEARRLWGV
ncbi:alpha/beta fold hydrolase [Sphingosinicella sp. CPCC 101087]|uniref:alpha/beta fold hydrolase n=1 Tax=Sphingosinicella sp. CPCC 101087 TaxID=2497754 RepID=UPI00101DA78B|nr:alpha/beta hydrolase [Sphingosinicella sp. CPCC 101087]